MSDLRPTLSRFSDIDEAARRQSVREVVESARRDGRSLVVEIDGEVREVPASELLSIEELEAKVLFREDVDKEQIEGVRVQAG